MFSSLGEATAGTEAPWPLRASARVGSITSALETICQMSCTHRLGGVAKGTVAREVDALGGIMGRATDLANPVSHAQSQQGTGGLGAPTQCDRGLYRRAVRSLLESHDRLATIQVLWRAHHRRRSVIGSKPGRPAFRCEGHRYHDRHVPSRPHPYRNRTAWRRTCGGSPATHLAEQLERLGLTVSRFKTGTPRANRWSRSINRTFSCRRGARRFRISMVALLGTPAFSSTPLSCPCWITSAGRDASESSATPTASAMYGARSARGTALLSVGRGQNRQFPMSSAIRFF